MNVILTKATTTGGMIRDSACYPNYEYAPKKGPVESYQSLTENSSKTIVINGISFIIDASIKITDELKSHLHEAAQIIHDLNPLLPENRKVRAVRINGNCGRTHFVGIVQRPDDATTSSALAFKYDGNPINLRAIYHEFGHALYSLPRFQQDQEWRNIWQQRNEIKEGSPAFKIVDDSEYETVAPDALGHPEDSDPSELFASAFQAIAYNRPVFNSFCDGKYKEHAGFGLLILRYMEERVF